MEIDELKEKFKLSNAEFDEIQNLIINIYTANVSPSASPTIIILGGQPGAGKSELITAAHRLASVNKERIVTCNADDYRDFHPNADEIKEKHEEYYSTITVEYAHRWNAGLRLYCEKNKLNYILETTFSSGELMNDTLMEMKAKGYQTVVMLLAVNRRWSILGTYLRYEDMKRTTGYGRQVTKRQHDSRYEEIPKTLKAVQGARLFDQLLIYGRAMPGAEGNGRGVYPVADNPENPLETYISERDKPWTASAINYFEAYCQVAIQLMQERNAESEYIEEFRRVVGD